MNAITSSGKGFLLSRKSMPSTVICRLLLSSLAAKPRCFKYHSAELNSAAVASTMVSMVPHRETRSRRLGEPAIVENAKNGRPPDRFAPQRVKELDAAELGTASVLPHASQLVEYTAQFRIGESLVGQIDGLEHLRRRPSRRCSDDISAPAWRRPAESSPSPILDRSRESHSDLETYRRVGLAWSAKTYRQKRAKLRSVKILILA